MITLCLFPSAQAQSAGDQLRIEKVDQPAGWKIFRGEQLVAGYRHDSNGKPIVYPITTPGGKAVTRNFPMTEGDKTERSDHDHHRSLWFSHGEVNGIDFWLDDQGCGKIAHRDGTADIDDNGAAVLITRNDWLDPQGKRLLSDTRRFSFRDVDGRRFIDCDILLKATDGDVNFGDTKEGSFGMRVAGTMKVKAEMGGKITNAEGLLDKEAWGQQSAWTNYSGPVGGDTVSITIHDHPSSFGYPCRWHVRTYGLFAANPFGLEHFTGEKDRRDGIVLTDGKQFRLNYRVVIEDGQYDAEVAEADSKQFANDPRPMLE